jgi:tetratricopeptide (TPR) repeat protein
MQSANDVLIEAHRCHTQGDFGRAEYLYCKLIAHAEDHPVAYFGLGTLYAQLHCHGRAIAFLKRAIELQPDGNGAMENLAAVYREMESRDKARYWGERALSLSRTPIALSNMAGTFINDGHPEEALKWAEEALAVERLPQALNHKALALLELGRFEEGWKIYDARLDLPNIHRRPFTCPMWDGKPVKRLAIHGEQGWG